MAKFKVHLIVSQACDIDVEAKDADEAEEICETTDLCKLNLDPDSFDPYVDSVTDENGKTTFFN